MTLVQSIPTAQAIYVTVDSANTIESNGKTSVVRRSKTFVRPGAGLVVVYGNLNSGRDHLGPWWTNNRFKFASFEDLFDGVMFYVLEEVPYLESLDFGYHVAGFTKDGIPSLFNLWISSHGEQQSADHQQKDPRTIEVVYNGKHELAHPRVRELLRQASIGHGHYDFLTPQGIIGIEQAVVRSVAKVTSEVGGPYYTYIIRPDNSIESIPILNAYKPRVIQREIRKAVEVGRIDSNPFSYENTIDHEDRQLFDFDEPPGVPVLQQRQNTPRFCIPDSMPGTATTVSMTVVNQNVNWGSLPIRRRIGW